MIRYFGGEHTLNINYPRGDAPVEKEVAARGSRWYFPLLSLVQGIERNEPQLLAVIGASEGNSMAIGNQNNVLVSCSCYSLIVGLNIWIFLPDIMYYCYGLFLSVDKRENFNLYFCLMNAQHEAPEIGHTISVNESSNFLFLFLVCSAHNIQIYITCCQCLSCWAITQPQVYLLAKAECTSQFHRYSVCNYHFFYVWGNFVRTYQSNICVRLL